MHKIVIISANGKVIAKEYHKKQRKVAKASMRLM